MSNPNPDTETNMDTKREIRSGTDILVITLLVAGTVLVGVMFWVGVQIGHNRHMAILNTCYDEASRNRQVRLCDDANFIVRRTPAGHVLIVFSPEDTASPASYLDGLTNDELFGSPPTDDPSLIDRHLDPKFLDPIPLVGDGATTF